MRRLLLPVIVVRPRRMKFLIYSLVVNETSAAALLKGNMFLGVLVEMFFLKRTLGSIRRTTGQVEILRGIPKGASPLCVVVGGGFLRGRGSRNTLPLKRAFGYFSHERKVTRGPGAEPPQRLRAESQRLGGRNVSPPPGGTRI